MSDSQNVFEQFPMDSQKVGNTSVIFVPFFCTGMVFTEKLEHFKNPVLRWMMARRKVTEEMLERQRIREAEIAAIPELSDSVQQIVSREGFIRLFHELRGESRSVSEYSRIALQTVIL